MPNLRDRFHKNDLGFLRIVAGLWGVDLNAPDVRTGLPALSRAILDSYLVGEVVEALPEETRQALDALILNHGWMPWSRFTRKFGGIREVGPGKRDREKPYLDPISPTERLWYLGILGRDFLKKEGELRECAYIPDDLLSLMPPVIPESDPPPGRGASPREITHKILANDRILDHCCTLLAALRLADPQRSPIVETWQPPISIVHAILDAMKLITSSEQPVPEDARPFLEMPRGGALQWLVQGWRTLNRFNELRLVPGLICEGAWQNEPLSARERILALMSEIPEHAWWHLDSFIKAVYERDPDFQRSSGDFDTWLVRDANTGQSLSGIQNWGAVDGALIRFLITGPMHWLGLIDLASTEIGQPVSAFRFSKWFTPLMLGKSVGDLPTEDQPVESFSNGRIIVSRLTPRIARYQIARFCDWVDESDEKYIYQITPASLTMAANQGLKTSHLEILLRKYGSELPPSLLEALKNWDKKGGQVQIEKRVVLRVETPQILQALRASPAGRFIDDPLGPTAALIHPDAIKKVSAALARLGYLSDIDWESLANDRSFRKD